MKTPPTPPEDGDGNDSKNEDQTFRKNEVIPSSDTLHKAQQKHRAAERDAIRAAIEKHLGTPGSGAAFLERIRPRWDTGILNQLHIGRWKNLWPLIDAARRAPGLHSGGLVVFGGWHGSPPEDIMELSPPPQELTDTIALYAFHKETLRLINQYDRYRDLGNPGTHRDKLKKHLIPLSIIKETYEISV